MSILIRGGRIVTAADDYVADVLVEGETDRADRRRARRRRRPDDRRGAASTSCRAASTRTRISTCRSAARSRSTTSSRARPAAAFGGTTCHVDFCIQGQGQTFAEALETLAREGERQGADRLRLPHRGHRPARERGAARGARDAARAGDHLVQALHGLQERPAGRRRDALPRDGGRCRERRARDGARRERRRDRRPRAARRSPAARRPRSTTRSRGRRSSRARRRTARSSSRASPAAPLYVVHVTCREAVEPIRRAREQGWDVWGETCTQYFFRSIDDLAQPDFEGAKYVYSPPARDAANHAGAVGRRAHRRALGDLDRPLRVPLGRPEDARQGRLHEDPERRPRPRGPARR